MKFRRDQFRETALAQALAACAKAAVERASTRGGPYHETSALDIAEHLRVAHGIRHTDDLTAATAAMLVRGAHSKDQIDTICADLDFELMQDKLHVLLRDAGLWGQDGH